MTTEEKPPQYSTINCEQCKKECTIEDSYKGSFGTFLHYNFCSMDCGNKYMSSKNIYLTFQLPKNAKTEVAKSWSSSVVLNGKTINFKVYMQNGRPVIETDSREKSKLILRHSLDNDEFRELINSHLQ